ncbi:response regulator transcription factor [uncultured Roseovarius sp.]|uniref:response regulator transcription factor n=1 Tax=uncultured Roseovarius sp. TaxID=293344 RepID=UPI002611A072|nr:response regulator transcription factor [uncultured Roseovarius sp.]
MPLRALVLDEDRTTHSLVTDRLADEGFETVSCGPDDSVLATVERHQVHICLVATRYRGLDGYEIARDLRHRSAAGVIVMGNSNDEIDTVMALEMGADDYLAKPIRPRELCARVRSVLRRTVITPLQEGGARPLPDRYLRRVDDMEICGVVRSVNVSGRLVDLTTLEFDVLMVLASHTNAILSRDKIINSVHGSDWSISHRSVDGIISRLRRKLFDSDEGNRRIKTVHGRGYVLLEAQSEGKA